ncbi:MAG TPA: LemA family protein [Acholeplasmataceae bacterium]|jgi:LemA protein|nr:LemA family protein [Acholeplasmataceae bacterium]
MANQLDELTGPVNPDGRDVNVIHKQIPIKVGVGSTIFEIFLWFPLIIPGLIFLIMKIKASNYLRKLEQKIQHNASQIDNYLTQRVVILQNVAAIVNKAVELDKDVMKSVARYRSGAKIDDANRSEINQELETAFSKINVAFEAYPDLKAHESIASAMQQNSYLQKEITAAREIYNDTIRQWNYAVNSWPTKMIVAARNNYTTRIPFSAPKEIKEQATQVFF